MDKQHENPLGVEPINHLMARLRHSQYHRHARERPLQYGRPVLHRPQRRHAGKRCHQRRFPPTITCTAVSLLFGIGGAANFNLSMGRKKPEEAKHFIGNAIFLMLSFGITLCLLVFLFLDPLLKLFGATADILTYSRTYTSITAFGFPFVILATGGSNLVRADGSPNFSMACTLIGCLINLVLDPLFIFVFHMGMAGAAWATIIGQIISASMVIWYLTRFKTVKLTLKELRPRAFACRRILSLGMSPFLNQLAIMIVQVVMNNVLVFYGGQSVYGSEIPLACAGIISKVNMIFFSISIGLSQGMQPIASFNYGAENYGRVREAVIKTMTASTLICTVAFILFQLFPRQITGIFGSGSEEYFTFASRYFRIFLFFTFLNGIQPVAGNFFTAIGKPVYGIFISLTRQILFLLPLILILPQFFGIDGVLYSAPIADFMAAVLAFFLTFRQLNKLGK